MGMSLQIEMEAWDYSEAIKKVQKLLDKIVKACVPYETRPNRKQNLKIDLKFRTYAKAIVWNAQKSMGRKITRENSIRTGIVSLSEFEYLGA